MSEDQGGVKKKLFGFLQNAIGKLETALDDKPAPQAPPAPGKGATGPLSRASGPLGQAPAGSGPLSRGATAPLPGQAAGQAPAQPLPGARAAQTGRLVKGSDSLVRSTPAPAASGPLVPPAPAKKDPAEAAEESAQRMGFIIAYMNDPAGDPMFQDKALVYKVVTEERSYQQNRIVDLTKELEGAAPGSPEASELEAQITIARNRQGQLFTLLKRLTGVRGKTGGTGFLGKPADETPPDPKPNA